LGNPLNVALRSRTFARDRRTWLATLAIAAVVWAGTSAWLNRRVAYADRRPAGEANDGRFVALAYDRIVAVPDGHNLDRTTLREQLLALAKAGWQPVTLGELADAYAGKKRLPLKPILLTFDEGYLATYEAADPVLRELRWPAVMFLKTDRQEERDVSFLFWDRLRRMAQSGLWEIASGDPPFGPAPGGKLPKEPPGFALIGARLDLAAGPAWAPRGTEPLVALQCSDEPSAWLGFVDDPVGANDPESSPRRIARLRVDPHWTVAELLRRADVAVAPPVTGRALWVPGEGVAEDGGTLRLEGRPRADAWIPSTRWADDWRLEATVRLGSGELWIAQPGSVPGREWRVGGTHDGLYVQDRRPGEPPYVLARSDAFGARDAVHEIRVVKRGAGIVVTWDGAPLSATPVALPGRWRGRVGIVAYGGSGAASATVRRMDLTPLPYDVRIVSAQPDSGEVAMLARAAEDIAALSPPWAVVTGSSATESPFDRDLFRILARRYAWDVVPTAAIRSADPAAAEAWLRALPERIAHEGWDGVRLDLRAARAAEWAGPVRELREALERRHLRLVVVSS
jgi:hypothetical protein